MSEPHSVSPPDDRSWMDLYRECEKLKTALAASELARIWQPVAKELTAGLLEDEEMLRLTQRVAELEALVLRYYRAGNAVCRATMHLDVDSTVPGLWKAEERNAQAEFTLADTAMTEEGKAIAKRRAGS